ncbi:hypothetical protein ACQI4L_12155 [Mycolicibacterium litorale]|uniref:nSTAND1 domain-containing NTPase n=1 Tax=Mycolicibacterium litorale TaxID=758802 RepID=UPI003CF8E54E
MTLTTAPPQLDTENPWPGLESFQENAHAYFFGRTEEAMTLLGHVLDTPVTVLYGRSGLGKTSLLRAGLFPLLRERQLLPVYVRLELQPGAAALSHQLRQFIRNAIRVQVPDAMLPADDESLWEYLHRRDFELWSAQNYLLTPVIVIDQFEEIFTLGERVPELVEEFRNAFGDLAENRIPADLAARIEQDEAVAERFDLRSRKYKLLISLREDFLPALEEWCGLIPSLSRSRVRLRRLRAAQALDAVHEPAAHLITKELASRVVGIIAGEELQRGHAATNADGESPKGELAGADVEPALLSLFCRELNEERKRRGLPRFDEQMVEDAKRHTLSNYYISCVHGLPPRVASFIETELITEKGFRDFYIREDAVPRYLTEEELDQLIELRLLRLEDRDGAQWIELTHDVLTDVVREHRDARRAEEEREALTARAAELEAAQRSQQEELTRAHEHAAALRKRSRILVALLTVAAVATVAAVGASVWAFNAKQDAQEAQLRAQENLRAGTVQKLIAEAQGILNREEPGTDTQALEEILAASFLDPSEQGALYTAVTQRASTLKVMNGHDGIVNSIEFSPDGALVASSGDDHTVRLWNVATGQQHGAPMRGHDDMVEFVAFSPDGERLASASDDGTVRLWETDSGRSLGEPMKSHDGTVWAVAFSPDGTRLASAGDDGTVRFWDTADFRQTGVIRNNEKMPILGVAFSPDGERLATAGMGTDPVRLWDAASGQQLRAFQGHMSAAMHVVFSPDGQRLASSGWDKTVRLWEANTGRSIDEPLAGHGAAVGSVAFSPDGQRLASASWDNTVRVWGSNTGAPAGQPLVGHTSAVTSVAFSPDGHRLATSSWDGTVRVWSADAVALRGHTNDVDTVAFSPDERRLLSASSDGAVRLWDPLTDQPVGEPIGDRVSEFAFSRDGRRLAVSRTDGTVQLWNPDTGQPLGAPLATHADSGTDIVLSRDARRFASIGRDNTVRIWDAVTRKPVGEPLAHTEELFGVLFSPDGDRLATDSGDHTERLWDAETGRPIGAPLSGHNNTVVRLTFSPDGDHFATADSDNEVRLWNGQTGQPVGDPLTHDDEFEDFSFSPDGDLLVTTTLNGTLTIWNANSGAPIHELLENYRYRVTNMLFSPDGRRLAAASHDNTVRLWEPYTGELIGEPLRHTGSVTDVNFSPDSTFLATASDDRMIRMWDTATGESVGAPLEGHTDEVIDIEFGPNGGQLASASADDSVRLWPAQASPEMLCDKLNSNMSHEQWREWVSPAIPYQPLCDGLPVLPDGSS